MGKNIGETIFLWVWQKFLNYDAKDDSPKKKKKSKLDFKNKTCLLQKTLCTNFKKATEWEKMSSNYKSIRACIQNL